MSDEKIERYQMFQEFQTAQMMPPSSFVTLAKMVTHCLFYFYCS